MFTRIKEAVTGFDKRNRDTGGNLSKRFVKQLATDLKIDLRL